MTHILSSRIRFIFYILLASAVLLAAYLVLMPNLTHAQEQDDDSNPSPLEQIIDALAPAGNNTSDDNNSDTESPAPDSSTEESATQSQTPVSTTTPQTPDPEPQTATTSIATTTPEAQTDVQRENQSTKDKPPVNPEYNRDLEDILNQVVPAVPVRRQTPPPEPTITPDEPERDDASTSTDESSDTENDENETATSSTMIGSTDHQTPGVTGNSDEQIISYYVPLDSLSPKTTYTLSGLAMVIGIIGAVFIIRDPRQEIVWSPSIRQHTLLES